MPVAAPFLRVNSFATTGPPLPAVVGGSSPTVLSVTGPAATRVVPANLTLFLLGTNLNNQVAQYNQSDFAYNINTGITYGAFACTATGNGLSAGPVWNKFTEDERDYINLARRGCNSIALGIDWHWWGGSDPTTAQAQAAFAVVDQHIAWCKKYGMRLSLRLFVPPGGTQTYNGNGSQVWGGLGTWNSASDNTTFMNQIRDFWKMVAGRYSSEPAIIGYDLLNEPSTGNIYTVWYPYANYLCDQINSVDPNHLKIVQSGGDGHTYHPTLSPRSDVLYSIHQYGPLDLTTPVTDGPFKTYPGPIRDYDSMAARALNGSCLATGNLNMGGQGGLQASGEAVVENELITYSNVRAWQGGDPGPSTDSVGVASQVMIVTARGASGTTASTHPAFAAVEVGCKLTVAILSTDVMAGAGTITVDSTAGWPNNYVTFDNEDFTLTGKTPTTFTGVTRQIDGTPAQAHPSGAIGRNQKYWNKTTLDQVFRVQNRADLAVGRPTYIGEAGCVNSSPGYSQWQADMFALASGAWVCNMDHFLDRSPNTTQNLFGAYNANAGGGYLSLTAVLSSEMTSLQTLDNTLQNVLTAAWPGNPVGRTV